jgi:hypothetical protein
MRSCVPPTPRLLILLPRWPPVRSPASVPPEGSRTRRCCSIRNVAYGEQPPGYGERAVSQDQRSGARRVAGEDAPQSTVAASMGDQGPQPCVWPPSGEDLCTRRTSWFPYARHTGNPGGGLGRGGGEQQVAVLGVELFHGRRAGVGGGGGAEFGEVATTTGRVESPDDPGGFGGGGARPFN